MAAELEKKRHSMAEALGSLLSKDVETAGKKRKGGVDCGDAGDAVSSKKRDKKGANEEEGEVAEGGEKKVKALTRARKMWLEKEHVIPDITSLSYERQLIKLATRGVVKLFNAVQKQQKVINAGKAEISKSDLFNMLKSGKASSSATATSKTLKSKSQVSNFDDDELPTNTKATQPQWSVLKDDFLSGKGRNFKDWDRNVSDDDDDNDDYDDNDNEPGSPGFVRDGVRAQNFDSDDDDE